MNIACSCSHVDGKNKLISKWNNILEDRKDEVEGIFSLSLYLFWLIHATFKQSKDLSRLSSLCEQQWKPSTWKSQRRKVQLALALQNIIGCLSPPYKAMPRIPAVKLWALRGMWKLSHMAVNVTVLYGCPFYRHSNGLLGDFHSLVTGRNAVVNIRFLYTNPSFCVLG